MVRDPSEEPDHEPENRTHSIPSKRPTHTPYACNQGVAKNHHNCMCVQDGVPRILPRVTSILWSIDSQKEYLAEALAIHASIQRFSVHCFVWTVPEDQAKFQKQRKSRWCSMQPPLKQNWESMKQLCCCCVSRSEKEDQAHQELELFHQQIQICF